MDRARFAGQYLDLCAIVLIAELHLRVAIARNKVKRNKT
jgi:hypothetical protein